MLPLLTMTSIEESIRQKYPKGEKIVGIMLANHKIEFVRRAIRICYGDWDVGAGENFDIYWPGYGVWEGVSSRAKTPPLVNFNAYLDEQRADELIASSPTSPELENPNDIRFVAPEYEKAKTHIRQALNLTRYERIDSLTLLLVTCRDGALQYDRDNTLVLNLRELDAATDPVPGIGELVSEVNDLCAQGHSMQELRKAVKAHQSGRKAGWKLDLSGLVNIVGLLTNTTLQLMSFFAGK